MTDQRARLRELRKTLAFFRSVIQSGEEWTRHTDEAAAIRKALEESK